MMKKITYLMMCVGLLLLASCRSQKNFVYLQDMAVGEGYPSNTKHEAIVQSGDRLGITVSSRNPEVAVPFNVNGGSFSVGKDGTVTEGNSEAKERGYKVDMNGDIEFPILGKLHVAGLTAVRVAGLIKDKIISGNYIKDPLVDVEFLNFKYSVVGAVGHSGTFTADDGRVTLLEAIAKAGDLTARARVNRVGVLREENGVRKLYMQDLRSKDLFNSPCFYLQQNDVVYVEPKFMKKDTEDKTFQYTATILSFITAVCSLMWAIKK